MNDEWHELNTDDNGNTIDESGRIVNDDGSEPDGWHVERWGEPKPIGAVWLRFYLDPCGELQFDVVSAVV